MTTETSSDPPLESPPDTEQFYRAAVQRIYRVAMVLSLGGAAGCTWAFGAAGLGGFAVGAAASWVTLRTLQGVAESLGQAGKTRPRKRIAVFLGLRYVVIGVAGYVIIRSFGANAIGLVLGLSVMVTAVIGEAIYELLYART